MLLKADGSELGEANAVAGGPEKVEQTDEQKQEELLSKPFLGVDAKGNLTLHIPFATTNEILARGLVDVARSKVLEFYARQAKAQAEEQRTVAALAAKTGYGRFKDTLAKMAGRR